MKLVGERRAIAAVVLVFYGIIYAALAVSGYAGPMETSLLALAGCYGLAFFSLVAGYFWARWFALGVLLFGVIQGALGLWIVGAEPVVVFMTITHALATIALWGGAMAVPYDGQPAWRAKFHMDDVAVQRLGRSVIRAGFSLPFVLLYAFAPKEPASALAAAAALGLAIAGFRGLVAMRTWGVLALGAAGAVLAVASLGGHEMQAWGNSNLVVAVSPLLASLALLASAAPFARPIARRLAA